MIPEPRLVDRAHRLADLWSWLPAFRAVAETEHLPTAAAAMHVSASALSRSVTLLEHALGHPLFTRTGRRIRLNPAGLTLLAAVRDAMRWVDDGLGDTTGPRPTRIRAAGHPSWLGVLVIPLLAQQTFEIEHVEIDMADARSALLRGAIDLAIAETLSPGADIVVESLGTVARAVCSAHSGRAPDGFAVSSDVLDGWPVEKPRTIGLRCSRLESTIEACRAGVLRCILPVAIARAHGLRIARTPLIAPSQLYLARRASANDGNRDVSRADAPSSLDGILLALRERAQRVLHDPSRAIR